MLGWKSKTLRPFLPLQLCLGAGGLTAPAQRLENTGQTQQTSEKAFGKPDLPAGTRARRPGEDSQLRAKPASVLLGQERTATGSKRVRALQQQQLKGIGEFNQAATEKKEKQEKLSIRTSSESREP